MHKIIIKVPEKPGDKFRMGWGARPRSVNSSGPLLNRLERLILRLKVGEKTLIMVKYGKGTSNETLASNDKEYLLYTTACFLEDYSSADSIRESTRRWVRHLKKEGDI